MERIVVKMPQKPTKPDRRTERGELLKDFLKRVCEDSKNFSSRFFWELDAKKHV